MKQEIAIKLGSTVTTIFKQGEGLVLKEPSVIAVAGAYKSQEIKAVGIEAQKMEGRTNGSISVVYPINNGIITDSELASSMLKSFLKKIMPRKFLKPNIKAIVCVPLGLSVNEKKTFERVCYNAGIADVALIPAILCYPLGDNIPIDTHTGKLIVSIGGGCTNIAAINMNTIITGINISVGGSIINTAIEKFILDNYNLRISQGTSERIKREVASLLPNDVRATEVQGVNQITKESETIVVSTKDIFPIVDHYYGKIAEAISSVIASCPTDIASDISHEGIYLFGGHSLINGLSRYFKNKLSLKINISENSKTDIYGAAKLLDNPTQYHDIIRNN